MSAVRWTRSRPSRAALTLCLLAALAAVAFAEGGAAAASGDEALFGDNELVTKPADTARDNASSTFEKRGIELGGEIGLAWSADMETGLLTQAADRVEPGMGLYMDARPASGFRVYARGRYRMSGASLDGTFSVEELFADLDGGTWGRLRVGKQAANWGLGYWWSPADILSLQPINQGDPTAARRGPIAIKYTLPFGLNQLSFYTTAEGATSVDDLGLAGRLEVLALGAEFGLGGYWRGDGVYKPRLVGTASFKAWSIDCYAEGLVSLGSEEKYAAFSGGPPSVSSPEGARLKGAAGIGWSEVDREGRWELRAMAEYYFNGNGVADSSYADNNSGLAALVAGGSLAVSDLAGYGRHYAGLLLAAEDLWSSRLGLDGLWRSNLSEGSATWRAVAVWMPVEDFRVEAGWKAMSGPRGGEYSPSGDSGSLDISIRLLSRATLGLELPLAGAKTSATVSFSLAGKF